MSRSSRRVQRGCGSQSLRTDGASLCVLGVLGRLLTDLLLLFLVLGKDSDQVLWNRLVQLYAVSWRDTRSRWSDTTSNPD